MIELADEFDWAFKGVEMAIAMIADMHHAPARGAIPIQHVKFPESEVGVGWPAVGHRIDLRGVPVGLHVLLSAEQKDTKQPCSVLASFLAVEFKVFTNDYHLLDAKDGRVPDEKADHPVVWISAYVAAIYLNWKTLTCGFFTEADCYYRVLIDAEGQPFVERKRDALGFRLPTDEEWLFAARANDTNDYPWDRYFNSDYEEEKKKGKRLEYFLTKGATRGVWTGVENEFGVFDMMGNVREWGDLVGNFEKRSDDKNCKCQVLGATPALGVETFSYNYEGISLPPRNTNLDVGFRWARSVSTEVKHKTEEQRRRRE